MGPDQPIDVVQTTLVPLPDQPGYSCGNCGNEYWTGVDVIQCDRCWGFLSDADAELIDAVEI